MIRINLVPGGHRRRRAGGGGFKLPSAGDLFGKIKEPLLLGAIASWVVAAGVVGALWLMQAGEVGELETRLERLEGEELRFRRLIAQTAREVSTRDSLVGQLEAIREIDGDRYVWPHVLEEVTKALPDFTWLVSIDAIASTFDALADTTVRPPVQFTIDGRTSDISAYTRFVSQLTNSPWVRAAEFGPIQSVIEQDRPVQAFTVTVTFQQADPRFLRTVPLQGSVIQ